jgi:hypothetical protein
MESKYKKIPNNQKQKVWSYMRRNRRFTVSDILLIVPVHTNFIRGICNKLVEIGALRPQNDAWKIRERAYILVEDKGARCPV